MLTDRVIVACCSMYDGSLAASGRIFDVRVVRDLGFEWACICGVRYDGGVGFG